MKVVDVSLSKSDKKGWINLLLICAYAVQCRGIATVYAVFQDLKDLGPSRLVAGSVSDALKALQKQDIIAVGENAEGVKVYSMKRIKFNCSNPEVATVSGLIQELKTDATGMLIIEKFTKAKGRGQGGDAWPKGPNDFLLRFRLIDDMLNMSKMEVGNLVLNKSLVRMRKLLDDAVNGVRSAAKTKSIELTANIAEGLPDVEADKEMVRVVVTNLLGNGIKYTQEGGRVFLAAELLNGGESEEGRRTIVVTVADNGPGIPGDEQDKIFEKFYRAQTAAEQKVVGNGLGLALAREIATLHGGDIKVESKVGEGSKFSFFLPAAETSRKVS